MSVQVIHVNMAHARMVSIGTHAYVNLVMVVSIAKQVNIFLKRLQWYYNGVRFVCIERLKEYTVY